ncbi:MAG: leucine-rich repeat domain-containing protein, partial [Clostridia bacterium]|nr:leucine-rich repeat domain-containing protein [Clostridia bacterium]
MEKSREENIIDSQKGNKDENHFTHKIATEANKKRRRAFLEKMIGLLCAFLLVGSILSYAIITKATAIDYQLSSDGSYYIVESVSRYVSRISVPKKHKGLPVKEIGDSAFQGRDLLKRVKIPSTVTRIGQKAFFGCNSLKKVEIEKGLEVIGDYAFACTSSLSEIYLPDSVEQLSMGVFSFCNSLKEVRLSEELTDIGSNAFSDCTSLTNVKIPDSVTIINQNAFNGCKTLKNVVIGKGVTQIGKGAFYNCKNLIEVLNYSRLSNETISETGLDAALCIHNGQTKVEKANGFMFITVDGENYLFDYEANDRRVVLLKIIPVGRTILIGFPPLSCTTIFIQH